MLVSTWSHLMLGSIKFFCNTKQHWRRFWMIYGLWSRLNQSYKSKLVIFTSDVRLNIWVILLGYRSKVRFSKPIYSVRTMINLIGALICFFSLLKSKSKPMISLLRSCTWGDEDDPKRKHRRQKSSEPNVTHNPTKRSVTQEWGDPNKRNRSYEKNKEQKPIEDKSR